MKPTKTLLTVAIAVLFAFILSCQKEIGFTPTPPPPPPPLKAVVLLAFSPDSVQVGDTVLLKGKNFDTTVANNQVTVNGTAGAVLRVNDSTLQFRVATGSTTGRVKLTSAGQAVTSTSDLRIYVIPWIRKADFPEILGPAGDINGMVLSFNSATHGYIYKSNKLWQYDPVNNVWTRKADLPDTRFHNQGICFAIGSKAYFGLGSNGPGAPPNFLTKQIWEYDMTTNQWTRKADFPGSKRGGCFSFAIGNIGYMGGGDTMNGSFNTVRDFWQYNSQTDTWTRLADYPGAKPVGSCGFSIQNMGFVFEGGFGSLMAPLSTFPSFNLWSYDPQANSWQQKSTLSLTPGKPATSATVFAINNKAYAALGATDTTVVSGQLQKKDFWEYDPQANTWAIKPQVGGPVRYFPCSFGVNGKGYVGMGTGLSVMAKYSDFWQYTPQ